MSQIIINVLYPTQAATLPDSDPTGTIYGYQNTGSSEQTWDVSITPDNLVNIQNVDTKTYASVISETAGALDVGGRDTYPWQQLTVVGGFQFATKDRKYVWRLSGGEDKDPIVLVEAPYWGWDALWGYEPVTQ